jgi:DNA-binding NarL/FixJ family response regulator
LIADDHPIVCKGIRNLLEPVMGIVVVGEASSGAQALEMSKQLHPDVMLLDMELPDYNGIHVVKMLAEQGSTVRVLGLSSYDDRQYISELLSLGAAGYLIKDEVPEIIIEAIRGVARGETGWVSRKVAAKMSQILMYDKGSGKDFTPRERDVLGQVVQGKTNMEIGLALGISEKTVEKHLDSIFRKMGVVSRVEAAVQAIRENYL